MNQATNKSTRLLLIGIIGLTILYTIYGISKEPFDLISTLLTIIILVCFSLGIRYHVKNINEPIGQELQNSFALFLATVFIGSILALGMYIYYRG